MKTYVILSTKHKSIYGPEWCLFHSDSGYVSDIRLAKRFTSLEAHNFKANTDYPIDVDTLGVSREYERVVNSNIRCLIEKGTINQRFGLNLKIEGEYE